MGRLLKQTKGGKFKIWSTVSDSYITTALTKKEAVKYLISELEVEYKLKAIELFYTFPNNFYAKDGGLDYKLIRTEDFKERHSDYYDWLTQALDSDDYYLEVNKKFNEIYEKL